LFNTVTLQPLSHTVKYEISVVAMTMK